MNADLLYRRFMDLLLCVTIIGAVYLRWPSDPQPFLSLDEAWRAMGAIDTHDTQILLASEVFLGRVGVALAGYEAIAFRVWPLLFSVAALTGVYALVSRTSSRGAGVCAAALVAFGPGFVYHAREFKPYAMDLALAVWSMWMAIHYAERTNGKSLAALTALLCLYAASSLTFVFVYPAILAFAWLAADRKQRSSLWPLLAPGVLFVLVYATYLRPQMISGGTINYWNDYYIDSLTAVATVVGSARFDISWFVAVGWHVAVAAYFIVLPTLAVLARDRVALMLFVPFVVQAGFASARLYPLFGRPSYYLYGLIAMALPYVVANCLRSRTDEGALKPRLVDAALIAGVLATLTLSSPLRAQLASARAWPDEQGQDVLRLLAEHQQPGEAMYLNYGAYYTYRFHSMKPGSPAARTTTKTVSWNTALRDNSMRKLCASLKGATVGHRKGDRLWFVSTHVPHAHIFYKELLRNIADVELVLGEMHQSLTSATLKKPLSRLACP